MVLVYVLEMGSCCIQGENEMRWDEKKIGERASVKGL